MAILKVKNGSQWVDIPSIIGPPGPEGSSGISPAISVVDITGGHRVTITDATGPHSFDVLNGADGQTGPAGKDGKDGVDGSPGADGTTFTPAVSAEGVISWTNDGGKTNPQPMNIKGPQGDDGTSPTISVADIPGGHRVSVTDANGTRSFDVMDGEDYVLTAADKAEIAQQAAAEVDVPVQDVQVNGTSILSNGVAEIPKASANDLGVAKVNTAFGLQMTNTNKETVAVQMAGSSEIKSATNYYKPIVPASIHQAVFWGLAKAAGADMASSSNPVGTYTDAAKIAIQKMLGIYEAPWELIREDTVTNATEANVNITVDGNGQAFELTDIILILWVPSQDNIAIIGDYGRVYFRNDNTNIRIVYLNAVSIPANSATHVAIARLTQNNGLMSVDYSEWTTRNNHQTIRVTSIEDKNAIGTPFGLNDTPINSISINTITGTMQYRLLGKRKWQ